MKKYLFGLICCLCCTIVYGQAAKITPTRRSHVPAYPGVITRIQPDNDTLHIYLRGDERQHYAMTLDGWQVVENEKGVLCYAIAGGNGQVKASSKQAHNEAQRTSCEARWLNRKGIKKEIILY